MNQPSETVGLADLRGRALRLLSRREYSIHELKLKLTRYCSDKSLLHAVVTDLIEAGWLSDQRCAEQVLRVRAGQVSSRFLLHELKQKGVDTDLVGEDIVKLRHEDLIIAKKLWQRKFGQVAENQKEKARQARFLQSRGFGFDVIRQVIAGIDDE